MCCTRVCMCTCCVYGCMHDIIYCKKCLVHLVRNLHFRYVSVRVCAVRGCMHVCVVCGSMYVYTCNASQDYNRCLRSLQYIHTRRSFRFHILSSPDSSAICWSHSWRRSMIETNKRRKQDYLNPYLLLPQHICVYHMIFMYICIYIYIYIKITCICTYHICVYTYICVYHVIQMYISRGIYVYMYMYICVYHVVNMYVSHNIYVHMYIT